jgi:type II secretory pathway pseudopilin PulG
MVVVAILAILSVVALGGYRRVMRRVRVSEAYGMLAGIRQHQESYFTEWRQYCDVSSSTHDGLSGSSAGFWPSTAPGTNSADWTGAPGYWDTLGVRPAGRVYFRYETVAGQAGVTPGFGGGLNYSSAPNRVPWFASHAFGDLDGDGVRSTFESFSMSDGIWVNGPETE